MKGKPKQYYVNRKQIFINQNKTVEIEKQIQKAHKHKTIKKADKK